MKTLDEQLSCMSLEKKAAIFTRAIMRKKIIETLEQSQGTQHENWLRMLCTELIDRICNLTPHRSDLRESIEKNFDVDLVLQMFVHQAFDEDDANNLVNLIFSQLLKLCAPVQDESICNARSVILNNKIISHKLSLLFEIAHEIISDIESLQTKVLENENYNDT